VNVRGVIRFGILFLALFAWSAAGHTQETLAERNAMLLQQLQDVHELNPPQVQKIRAIFERSKIIGQGNPAITRHPLTTEQCELMLKERGVSYANPRFERVCGAKYMAPLYDPATQQPEDATACIDQFEFPDIPCAYPVVWVRAVEAAEICAAEGKRLCDANEWEDACQGRTEPADYRFDFARGNAAEVAIRRMREAHNAAHAASRRWSYGPTYERGICATGSFKSAGCNGGDWSQCGSNTYPAGSFPACQSPLSVFDINGNAAEHMNLPLDPSQMSSRGSTTLGYTEMKGSWFIFDTYRAHEDWCRWRAPYWHGSRVMDPRSHENYHLGFRCCNTLPARSARQAEGDDRLDRLPRFLARGSP
jgi:formylglycine-generating enzyme required for sulfatase activity